MSFYDQEYIALLFTFGFTFLNNISIFPIQKISISILCNASANRDTVNVQIMKMLKLSKSTRFHGQMVGLAIRTQTIDPSAFTSPAACVSDLFIEVYRLKSLSARPSPRERSTPFFFSREAFRLK